VAHEPRAGTGELLRYFLYLGSLGPGPTSPLRECSGRTSTSTTGPATSSSFH